MLAPEYDPKGIAQRLKSQLTHAAKGVLVEHGYVDKDYRSTFITFTPRWAVRTGPTASVCTFLTGRFGMTKPGPISHALAPTYRTIISATS